MRLGSFLSLLGLAFTSFTEENMFFIELEASTSVERSKIANIIHIDKVFDDRIYSIIKKSDLISLQKTLPEKILSIEAIIDISSQEDKSEEETPTIPDFEFPDGDEIYHTYDEIISEFISLQSEYPHLVELFSIGKSVENRDIWALKITDSSEDEEGKQKPAIVYMGTHHAREHLSTEIPVLFSHAILDESLTENNISELLKEIEIYIIPIVNPDGALYDIQQRRYKYWRKNRKKNNSRSFGVDLNRNYSYGWGTGGSSTNPRSDIYMGTEPFSEPETTSIRNFFLENPNINIALSFHTYSELILYPWGGKNDGIGGEDENIFKKMATDMAAMNHYRPMQASDLYIASGDTCDWAYGELKVFCFTFELSPSSAFRGGFYPGASIIDSVFDANYEPMIYLANKAKDPRAIEASDPELKPKPEF